MKTGKGYVWLSIVITAAFLALGFTVFWLSFLRLIETGFGLFSSGKYFFFEMLGKEHNVSVNVTEQSKVL